jgi:glyoxylase-like metal-dependent hydrolase (beta-lactamase superfamily II)
MSYEVTVLKMGQADVPGPEVYWMSHFEQWLTLYFYMVVVRGNGITAIINTGPPQDLTDLNRLWESSGEARCRMVRQPEERPDTSLARVGIHPEEVTHVLITPLQAYATGNIPMFRNAEICLSRRGWIEDFHAPRFPLHSPRWSRIPNDVLMYLELEAYERLRLLEDEDEIAPGLRARWVGAHHRSSMAFDIITPKGHLIVSDAAFHYGNVEKPHPLGIAESLEECHFAYQRFRRADVFLPLYDPGVLDRHREGRVA